MKSAEYMRPAGEHAKPITRKFPFNREKLAAVKSPASDRVYVYDSKTPHLAYMVTSNNARSFVWYGRVRGEVRPIKARIGNAEELSLEQARDTATAWTAEALKGVSPLAIKQAAKGEIRFDEFFDSYEKTYAKVHKRSWKNDRNYYDNHLAGWAGRRAKSITQDEVRTLHARIGKDHPVTANRVVSLLSKMYNEAREVMQGHNPAKGIRKFKEQHRDRTLFGDELRAFFNELENVPSETMRDFFTLAIWTGGRRSNVLSMRWDEIDLARKLWTIPADKAKAERAIDVPLSPPAMEVLKRRHTGKGQWVLPSHSKSGHLQEPKKAWAELLKAAKLENVKIHDLRRTAGSWMATAGASLLTIGKTLGHRNQSTTAIYARLQLDPVRAAVNAGATAMQAAIDDKPKVVHPKGRKRKTA